MRTVDYRDVNMTFDQPLNFQFVILKNIAMCKFQITY